MRGKRVLAQILFASGLTVGTIACSVTGNTLESRLYHAFTTRYNLFYNASEAYRGGVAKLDTENADDFGEILPIFPEPPASTLSSLQKEMDVAIQKLQTAIRKHSIGSKPRMKPKSLAQQDFYNQAEFNAAIDNCRLLMGKAQFAKRDYATASETFSLLVRTSKGTDSYYPGKIWQIRAMTAQGSYSEAATLASDLRKDLLFPKYLLKDFALVEADLQIRRNNWEEAATRLGEALIKEAKASRRMRLRFIQAQLYERAGKREEAVSLYRKVASGATDYQLELNAWLGVAAGTPTGDSLSAVRSDLETMLSDARNPDYRDQIYYALARLDLRMGDSTAYERDLQRSSESSTVNRAQKGRSCLQLASIYAARKQFLKAAAYYDTAVVSLNENHSGFLEARLEAETYKELARLLSDIGREDSLAVWAELPPAEREARMAGYAAARAAAAAANDSLAAGARRRRQSVVSAGSAGTPGEWYFFNEIAVSRGRSDFYALWGTRPNEDNWRLRNRSVVASAISAAPSDAPGAAQPGISDLMPEMAAVLEAPPMNDSLRQLSITKRARLYYEAAFLLRQRLNDSHSADSLLTLMNERFPGNENELNVWYQLMKSASESRPEVAAQYASRIVASYPESLVARTLTDPAFVEQQQQAKEEAASGFEEVFGLWKANDFEAAVSRADQMAARFPESDLLPRLMFIRALSIGGIQGRASMREELVRLSTTFRANEILYDISDAIEILDQVEAGALAQPKVEERTYSYQPGANLSLVWLLDTPEEVNQLQFDLVSYAMGVEEVADMIPLQRRMGTYMALIYPAVRAIDAFRFYSGFFSSPLSTAHVASQKTLLFLINESDLQRLTNRLDFENYMEMFTLQYLPLVPESPQNSPTNDTESSE